MNKKWYLSEFKFDDKNKIYVPPKKKKYIINYSDGIKLENYILESIRYAKNISDDSDELMQMARDWPSYYHLGIGRSNIFKSLDIFHDANVLELGSGCGAITRYLGENFKSIDSIEGSPLRARIARERCRDLQNVKIFCSNFKYVRFNPVYDVVTLIGVLEYAPIYFGNRQNAKQACLSLLKLAKTALKPSGILIIAIENRIGLKYWSGCPEDHTGKIFEGIHGYPGSQGPITFSKKEIKILLEKAGFSNISFYYCFPDYKFTSTIINDASEEKNFHLHNWIEVPFNAHNSPRIFTFHEGLAIKTLSEAGLLGEFANSFLIVASQKTPYIIRQPDWIAKKFSMKRRKEFRTITTLRTKPNFHVEKKRLANDNNKYSIANNTITIKHKVSDSPWYKGDLMIFEVYKGLFSNDFKTKILELLKIYYQELITRYYIGTKDKEGYPLLRGDSFDFIFRNIIKEEKKLTPIDDEWQVEGYIPADFVMYRAITNDIIESQKFFKKIKNVDEFTIKLIKIFFPNYGRKRHKKNKMIENSFQDLVSGDLYYHTKFSKKIQFLIRKHTLIYTLVKSIWNKLPENIKENFKK